MGDVSLHSKDFANFVRHQSWMHDEQSEKELYSRTLDDWSAIARSTY